jgi:hypothetical protein
MTAPKIVETLGFQNEGKNANLSRMVVVDEIPGVKDYYDGEKFLKVKVE